MAEQLGDGAAGRDARDQSCRSIRTTCSTRERSSPTDGSKLIRDLRWAPGHEIEAALSSRCWLSRRRTARSSATWSSATAAAVAAKKRRRCARPSSPPARKSCPRAGGPTRSARRSNCAASERRPAALRGAGGGAEQLPLLQSLHDRMPVQRKHGAAEGGIAARADSRDGLSCASGCSARWIRLGRLGCRMPRLANARLDFAASCAVFWRRRSASPAQRPLPHYARQRFDSWFARHRSHQPEHTRGRVVLWDDTFVRYHEPHIGIAAVKVLEAAGFEVDLAARAQVLRPPGVQPGQPRRSRAARPAQPRVAEPDVDDPRRSFSWSRPAIPCSSRIIAS